MHTLYRTCVYISVYVYIYCATIIFYTGVFDEQYGGSLCVQPRSVLEHVEQNPSLLGANIPAMMAVTC